ncbi:leucine-rich repeat domain-containing protein [Aeoliella mucimassa]|uniref:Internalin-A n=1 Tax=Aeoliella mucimassa TaxID=2527972 RepID=A0A518AWF9_9BACT|nr:leucine-rich repeat protein [Aeoliella mucimassa]QDU59031.1 Internalin-A precursor [Aeoliella mucimassa]
MTYRILADSFCHARVTRLYLFYVVEILVAAILFPAMSQAFIDDGDGLLDVGEAPGYPMDPTLAWESVYLDSRSIQDLDGANLLVNVQELYLDNNKIASIESGDFNGLNRLLTLDLSDNQIAHMELGVFSDSIYLQQLDLSSNRLTSIESGTFSGLDYLPGLNLSRNRITSINAGTFSGLTYTQKVDLSRNRLTSIEPDMFEGLVHPRTLDFSFNRIAHIDSESFQQLDTLLILDLERNDVTNVDSGTFDNLSNLKFLNLSRNQLTSIKSDTMSGLISLQSVTFQGNHIQSIASGALAGLNELEVINLIDNDFTELNLSHATLSKLRELWIDRDAIVSLRLDGSELSENAWDIITKRTTSIEDVSLVWMTFQNGNPSDLNSLLSKTSLHNVWVDPHLYSTYATEFDTFDAIAGNTVTIVPEPSTLATMLVAACLLLFQRSFYRHP